MPMVRDLLSVGEVLEVHRKYGCRYGIVPLTASWSRISRLLGQLEQRRALKESRRLAAGLAELAAHSVSKAPLLGARQVANHSHAVASIQLKSGWRATPELWQALAARGRDVAADFDPQGLANTVWAFAKAEQPAPALFEVMADEAAQRGLGDFTPQALANMAWAFATAEQPAPALFKAVAEEAVRRGLGAFTPQNMANTAWAFAKAEQPAPALFEAVAEEAVRRGLGGFTPQGMANTAWAFATAHLPAPALFEAVAEEAVRRGLGEFNSQDMANTAWAFAKAEQPAPALFEAVEEVAARRGLGEFTPQALANTAWAFATAQQPAPALFEAVADEAVRRGLGAFPAQELANTMWALAVLDVRQAGLVAACSTRAAELEASLRPEDQVQLHQAQLWIEHEWKRPDLLLAPPLRAQCRSAMSRDAARSSALQKEVSRVLSSLEQGWIEEWSLPEGYSLNLASPERRVAIEVDGPSRFLGRGRQPTGATQLKRRQLRALGWAVVPVPYFEWDGLRGLEAKQDYSRKRLASLASGAGEAEPPPAPGHEDG